MILHHSQPGNDVDAYQAMERAVEAGKLRSIGLSNYYDPADFDRVVNATAIRPALLQAGNICIPGSSNEQHIIEDYDVWNFELTEDEMAQMTALEKDDRFADY